jgi:hypothetical protein
MAMLVVGSSRLGGKLYEHNLYLYKKNKTCGETTYFTCKEKCGVTAKVKGNEVLINGEHDHDNNLDEIQSLLMRQELRTAAAESGESHKRLRQVFEDVCERCVSNK